MVPEMEDQLQRSSKKQLVLLVQELALRHPDLQQEMIAIMERLAEVTKSENEILVEGKDDGEVDEEDKAAKPFPSPRSVLSSIDHAAYRQRLADYLVCSKQKKLLQWISDDLINVLKEAEQRASNEDYLNALEIYALVIDERLAERNAVLTPIFDNALKAAMPVLYAVLTEASSNVMMDSGAVLTPLLTSEMRQRWLERLFALWLKRLDVYHMEEDVPEIMLEIAWTDDLTSLRCSVQEELQRLRQEGQSNIVDVTRLHRTHVLERFLKELPPP